MPNVLIGCAALGLAMLAIVVVRRVQLSRWEVMIITALTMVVLVGVAVRPTASNLRIAVIALPAVWLAVSYHAARRQFIMWIAKTRFQADPESWQLVEARLSKARLFRNTLARISAPDETHTGSDPERHQTDMGVNQQRIGGRDGISKPVKVIDGIRFTTLDEFYDEVERVLIPGVYWGRNLDAFNDILRGGFEGIPDEPFVLMWRNAALSQERLSQFSVLVEIIRDHGDVELRLE